MKLVAKISVESNKEPIHDLFLKRYGDEIERNRPFLSSLEPLFQSESKCESFVMVISSAFHMNENSFPFQRLRT